MSVDIKLFHVMSC